MRVDQEELRARITEMSDEELLNMVEVEAPEYREDALDYARAQLTKRGVQFQEPRKTEEPRDIPVGEPQKLFTCTNVAQAGLLSGLLLEMGIECETRKASLSMASGLLPFSECFPELWVSGDENFKRAKEFVDEWQRKEWNQPASWTCQGCGEENEGQFSSCWNCQRPLTL